MPSTDNSHTISPESFNWKKYIDEALQATEYCCLATVDQKGVWSNPVYYAWDDQYNLYFISQMHSRHMQNLTKNSRVAISVFKTEQKGDVVGIQLEGDAEILLDDTEAIQHAFTIYHGRTGGGEDVQQYINDPTWIFVKVIPERLYYFDTRFFEEERQQVPLQLLKQ